MMNKKKLRNYLADLIHDRHLYNYYVPLNVGYIAANINKRFGDLVETKILKFPDDLISKMKSSPPDILGLSNYDWNVNLNKALIKIARQINQDVFIVDEIHRLNSVVEEYLYSAMEDYRIEIMIDKGPGARSIQLNLEPFTLVGATTRLGNLTSPLRDRFGVVLRVDYYDPEDLFQIVTRSAEILEVEINEEGAHELAKRSRGTPRIANRILRRTRDYAQVKAKGRIDKTVVQGSLEYLGIDEYGLDDMDRTILSTLIEKFNGGPVGVNSLSVAVSEDTATIEDVYEPYLIKEGFIQRTSRGRIAQEQAYSLLGKTITKKQQRLFK